MEMDLTNPTLKLCMDGTHAEFEGRKEDACDFYRRAWETATDDYEACVAAHYMARCQADPEEVFRWNREALERADAAKDDRVQEFYPSLYLNMGSSYEQIGNPEKAQEYFDLAANLGFPHSRD